jgi:hypothetical protein
MSGSTVPNSTMMSPSSQLPLVTHCSQDGRSHRRSIIVYSDRDCESSSSRCYDHASGGIAKGYSNAGVAWCYYEQ